MSVTPVLRSLRLSLITALLLTVAFVGLVMAERATGPAGSSGVTSPSFTLQNQETAPGQAKKQEQNPGGVPRHCTDGHGKDAEHNKHCKVSQG